MANKRCRRETGIIRVYKRFSAELVPFERIEFLVRAVIHRDEIPIITHNGILEIFPLPIRNLTAIGITVTHLKLLLDNLLRIAYTITRCSTDGCGTTGIICQVPRRFRCCISFELK